MKTICAKCKHYQRGWNGNDCVATRRVCKVDVVTGRPTFIGTIDCRIRNGGACRHFKPIPLLHRLLKAIGLKYGND